MNSASVSLHRLTPFQPGDGSVLGHIYKDFSPSCQNQSENCCFVFASLTCAGNRHQEHNQHKHTCPQCVHGSLSAQTRFYFFLSLLVVSGCFTLIFFPLATLIGGSGWTDYLPVDSETLAVWTSKPRTTSNTHSDSLAVSCSAVPPQKPDETCSI